MSVDFQCLSCKSSSFGADASNTKLTRLIVEHIDDWYMGVRDFLSSLKPTTVYQSTGQRYLTYSIYSTIEVNVGLICACLMMLPAFLDRHLPPAVSESAARLWSYARDLTSRGRSSRGASLDDGRDDWPGYRQTAASGSQRLVKVDSKKQILRRESFSLETMPRDSSHRHTDSNKVTVESTNV